MKLDLNTLIIERLHAYKRVLQVARKPNKDEFVKIAKVTALGLGFIGLVGTVIYIASLLFIG